MKFKMWMKAHDEKFCALGALENVPKDGQIEKGVSRAAGWPANAQYRMRKDFPKQVKVPDSLYTMIHYVVSAKLREVLVPLLEQSRVEMLPVQILDHKGKAVPGEYFVMHPLDVVDCIDIEASGAEMNLIDPTTIMSVDNGLVLRDLPKHLPVLRPSAWKAKVLVREDVVEKLEKAGLTGLIFEEPEDVR